MKLFFCLPLNLPGYFLPTAVSCTLQRTRLNSSPLLQNPEITDELNVCWEKNRPTVNLNACVLESSFRFVKSSSTVKRKSCHSLSESVI